MQGTCVCVHQYIVRSKSTWFNIRHAAIYIYENIYIYIYILLYTHIYMHTLNSENVYASILSQSVRGAYIINTIGRYRTSNY